MSTVRLALHQDLQDLVNFKDRQVREGKVKDSKNGEAL